MKDIHLYEKLALPQNKFPVKLMKFNSTSSLAPHWHEHVELIYFLSGECDFTCNGKTFSVKADDFIFVNSTEIHSFTAPSPPTTFCIHIYPEFFYDVNYNQKIIIKNIIHNDKFIWETIKGMYGEYVKKCKGSDMVIKGTTYQLMAYLLRNYTLSDFSANESLHHTTKMERINKIQHYISTHYQKKITTASLAKLCFISESYLCHFFRNNFNKSVTEYINEFRIEKAAVMLTNTNESITNISTYVGFEDINYFSRIFKKIKNCSPQEYRKNHQYLL